MEMITSDHISRLEMKTIAEEYKLQIIGFITHSEPSSSCLPWQHLLDCLNGSQSLQQVASLKKFGSALKKQPQETIPGAEEELYQNVFTQLVMATEPKEPLHRTVVSILQSLPQADHHRVSSKMSSALCGQLSSCQERNVKDHRRCVDMISGLLENFPLGEKSLSSILDRVVSFLHGSLQVFMETTRCIKDTIGQNEAMCNCLVVVRTLMAVIQKCLQLYRCLTDETADISVLIEAVLHSMWTILADASYLPDCRSAAGMALVLMLRSLVTEGQCLSSVIYRTLFHHVSESSLSPSLPLSHRLYQLDTASLPSQSYLFICHGVLAMIDSKDLILGCLGPDGHNLLLHVLFPEILNLTQSLTESSSALIASRTLTLWTTSAVVATTSGCYDNERILQMSDELVGTAGIPQHLIQYVWTNWDHPIDGIRYQTKSILENVLQLHVFTQDKEEYTPSDDPFLRELLNSLVKISWHVRGKYMPLGCLVRHLGTLKILEWYPTMPQELLAVFGDQTLAPYACDLLASLFDDHKDCLVTKARDVDKAKGLKVWQRTWILPFLECLCSTTTSKDQKTYLIDYYIPRLLKCSPETLAFVVTHLLQTNDDSASLDKPGQLGAIVTCLKTARAIGLVKHNGNCPGGDADQSQSSLLWKGLVPYKKLKEALCHKDSQVRIDALGLLCDCNKTTEEVSAEELSLIQFFLVLNISSPSPSFRQQIGAYLKKLFVRLRENGRVCLKQVTHRDKKEKPKNLQDSPGELIKEYKAFLSWLTDHLFGGLQPGSCYPKRAVSLYTLKTMVQVYGCKTKDSKASLFDINEIWTPDHVQLLLHRLTDPYESNKVMAFDLLSNLPQETLGLMDKEHLRQLYKDALHLASSNKPHHCETAAFTLRLLARQLTLPLKTPSANIVQSIMGILEELCMILTEQVGVAKVSLLEAAVQGPMYGVLHCIRELLADVDLRSVTKSTEWEAMVTMMIKLCFDVADAASVVVCNSSPEGYIPVETDHDLENPDSISEQGEGCSSQQPLNEAPKALKVTPQMVLVCCWRSMKEVSLLMGLLASSVPVTVNESKPGLVSPEQLEEIGTFFLRLLKESKHRGAFELAYAGFIMLTTRLWMSEVVSLHQLPEKWLQGLLSDITTTQSMLCATRRSAGIPFAIQALVSSEPGTAGKRCFKNAMTTLLDLALPSSSSSDAIISQVHALNILRVLYKDTRLGEDVIPYIADGVRASVLGFAAQLWGVRNSSTLLFSSLVTRIFGVQRAKQAHDRRNCMTGKEFFARFPSLYPFLLQQLKEATSLDTRSGVAHLHPSLFPVLLLLSRLYPSPMDSAHSRLSMDQFVPYVLRCASNAVCKTRVIAARALVPLVSANHRVDTLTTLIKSLPRQADTGIQHNQIHGILLQIRDLLECILQASTSQETYSPLREVLSLLVDDYSWLASSENKCCVTRAAYLTILDEFVFKTSSWSDPGILQEKLKQDIMAITVEEIQNGSSKRGLPLLEPGFVTLQTTCASYCLRWVHLQEASAWELKTQSVETTGEDRTDLLKLRKDALSNIPTSQRLRLIDEEKSPSVKLMDVLTSLLSSLIYEVRLLTLTDLIQGSQSCCSEGTHHPWTDVMSSRQLFLKLVAMVYEEKHEQCLQRIYKLLAQLSLFHPFPWQTTDGMMITCAECFQTAVAEASQLKQREDLVCSIVQFTCSLIPNLYSACCKGKDRELECKLLSDWSLLLDQYSGADQTSQSRLTIVKAVEALATTVLIDPCSCMGTIPFILWGVVIRLLQDDDVDVQQGAMSCIKKVAVATNGCNDLDSMETQSAIGLHLGVKLFLIQFLERQPGDCLQSLIDWGVGTSDAESPEEDQLQDERLFDQGESNANFEGVVLGTIISKQILDLATAVADKLSTPGQQSEASSGKKHMKPLEAECESEITNKSQHEGKEASSFPSSVQTQSQDTSFEVHEMGLRRILKGDECIDVGSISKLQLSADVMQQLQLSAGVGLADLATRLEDCLQTWPATSPFLTTTEYEIQCVECCRILCCCDSLKELLPQDAASSVTITERFSRLLPAVKAKFYRDGQGSCNPMIKKPLLTLYLWCDLKEVE